MVPVSQRQYPILGLNLLRLLAQNRTAEFHTELELVPPALHDSNIYIKYPTQLEQYIMEGSFNKVLSARAEGLFSHEGDYFMGMLTETVREEIANCAEKAYTTMSAEHACQMLMLPALPELTAYAEQVRGRAARPRARAARRPDARARLLPLCARARAAGLVFEQRPDHLPAVDGQGARAAVAAAHPRDARVRQGARADRLSKRTSRVGDMRSIEPF